MWNIPCAKQHDRLRQRKNIVSWGTNSWSLAKEFSKEMPDCVDKDKITNHSSLFLVKPKTASISCRRYWIWNLGPMFNLHLIFKSKFHSLLGSWFEFNQQNVFSLNKKGDNDRYLKPIHSATAYLLKNSLTYSSVLGEHPQKDTCIATCQNLNFCPCFKVSRLGEKQC